MSNSLQSIICDDHIVLDISSGCTNMFNQKASSKYPYHHDVFGELNKQRQDLRNKKVVLELRKAIDHPNVKFGTMEGVCTINKI